jgi:hypothetical protein
MLLKGDLGISHLQREDAFSFYPYCFYDRDNGHVDLYLVVMSLISLSVIATRIALTFTSNLLHIILYKRESSLNHIRH